MAYRMDCSKEATVTMNEVVGERLPRLTITLYELLAVIHDVVGPEDDALVVATVQHLLQSGRLTWLGEARGRQASYREARRMRQRVAPL